MINLGACTWLHPGTVGPGEQADAEEQAALVQQLAALPGGKAKLGEPNSSQGMGRMPHPIVAH